MNALTSYLRRLLAALAIVLGFAPWTLAPALASDFSCTVGVSNVVSGPAITTAPCLAGTVTYALDIDHVVTRHVVFSEAEERRNAVTGTYWIEDGPKVAAPIVVPMATSAAVAPMSVPADLNSGFCDGSAALVFDPIHPLPATNPCGSNLEVVLLVEPWRAGCEGNQSDVDCNVGFKKLMTYATVLDWLAANQFDRGSIWFKVAAFAEPAAIEPANAPADSANPPTTDPGDWLSQLWALVSTWWLACCSVLVLLALVFLAFVLGQRNRPAA